MRTVKIIDIEHVDRVVKPYITWLGMETTVIVDVDCIDVTLNVEKIEKHVQRVSTGAIGSRMADYGLVDPVDAIEAIVREAVFLASPDLTAKDENDWLQNMGGMDNRIKIEWSKAAAGKFKSVLAHKQDHIIAHLERRLNSAPPPVEVLEEGTGEIIA